MYNIATSPGLKLDLLLVGTEHLYERLETAEGFKLKRQSEVIAC